MTNGGQLNGSNTNLYALARCLCHCALLSSLALFVPCFLCKKRLGISGFHVNSCDFGSWETWTNKTTDRLMPSQSQPVCIALLFFLGPSKIGSKRSSSSLGMHQTVEISWERELRCAIYSGTPSHNGITGFVEILCVISVSLARVTTQLPSQKRPLSRNLLLGVVYLNTILAHELSRLYICVLHSWLMCLFLVKIYPSWFKKVPKSSSLFEELALNPVTSTPPYLFNPRFAWGLWFSQACRRPTSTMDVIGIGPGAKVKRYTGWVGRWIDRWICRDRIFTCMFFVDDVIWNGGHNEKT